MFPSFVFLGGQVEGQRMNFKLNGAVATIERQNMHGHARQKSLPCSCASGTQPPMVDTD
jgi:hypothetical protein